MSAAETVIANIRILLKQNGLNQSEFCSRSGVPQTTFNRLRNQYPNEASPRLETIAVIARGFGVSIAELCTDPCSANPIAPPSPRALAKQLGRLVDDFLSCTEERRQAVLRYAEEQANEQ